MARAVAQWYSECLAYMVTSRKGIIVHVFSVFLASGNAPALLSSFLSSIYDSLWGSHLPHSPCARQRYTVLLHNHAGKGKPSWL